MVTNIKVSGNIISELSEKIPSNIVALNELIKNSYDAGAKVVNIDIDKNNKKLVISDDGCGMDQNRIEKLFHLSESDKKYGKISEFGRRVQGSKGLGFLSVFKFGGEVIWKTKMNNNLGYKFSAKYEDIINMNNITDYSIPLDIDDSIDTGTTIEIEMNDFNANNLTEYLLDEINHEKVLNSFTDNNFIIKLKINGANIDNGNISTENIAPERQIYHVIYNSEDKKLKFMYKDILVYSEDYEFDDNRYQLYLDLVIFKFKNGETSKVNKLFYNTNSNNLTPLIFVNDNLFNNYTIFDPTVMKNIKSGDSLNQMIGYIKIYSDDELINFNSTRTEFLQNKLTNDIINFLRNLNINIQTKGSREYKRLYKLDKVFKYDKLTSDYRNATEEKMKSVIKDDFLFKRYVMVNGNNDNITYEFIIDKKVLSIKEEEKVEDPNTLNVNIHNVESNQTVKDEEKNKNDQGAQDVKETQNGEENNKSTPVVNTAVIILKSQEREIKIPSSQIDLRLEIIDAKNSIGEEIDINDITIEVDGVKCGSKILASKNTICNVDVNYIYNDSVTGLLIKKLTLKFVESHKAFNFNKYESSLVFFPTPKKYLFNCNLYVLKIADQINELYKIDENKYADVIVCSLRSLFELSVDELVFSGKLRSIQDLYTIGDLNKRVIGVVKYVENDKKFIGRISNNIASSFHTLDNLINEAKFISAMNTANIGAHKSGTVISPSDIIDLGKRLALFIVIVNEIMNDKNIT